jgi:hypothetical protein
MLSVGQARRRRWSPICTRRRRGLRRHAPDDDLPQPGVLEQEIKSWRRPDKADGSAASHVRSKCASRSCGSVTRYCHHPPFVQGPEKSEKWPKITGATEEIEQREPNSESSRGRGRNAAAAVIQWFNASTVGKTTYCKQRKCNGMKIQWQVIPTAALTQVETGEGHGAPCES